MARVKRKTAQLPTVRVTPSVADGVRAAAEDLQRPIAWIVEDALRAWLDAYQRAPEATRERSERNS